MKAWCNTDRMEGGYIEFYILAVDKLNDSPHGRKGEKCVSLKILKSDIEDDLFCKVGREVCEALRDGSKGY